MISFYEILALILSYEAKRCKRGGKVITLTWRKEWKRPYESTWSIFEKIKLVNVINGNDLLNKINPEYEKGHRKYRNLNKLIGFNLDLLERQGINLKETIEQMERMHRLINIPIKPMSVFHTHLVYCDQCISFDYHSFLHQFKLIDICPFHFNNLSNKCENCNKEIYAAHFLSNNLPFSCHCGYSLNKSLDDPIWNRWGAEVLINDPLVITWLNKLGIHIYG